jgi:hypothetical protein
MSLAEPGQDRLFGHVIYQRRQRVTRQLENAFEVEFRQRLVEKKGPLCEHIPADADEAAGVVRIEPSGRIQAAGDNPRVPAFPEGEVEEGDAWAVQENPSDMLISFAVQKFEDRDGEVVARLVSQAETEAADGADSVHTEVGSEIVFSVTRGYQLSSKTLITQRWQSGRTLETVVETELQ